MPKSRGVNVCTREGTHNKPHKMPENYYCLDNFFQKMTDLESPRKNNDCYFYYYSTCTKGDSCTFRHEPSALGCETTCSFWKEGKCINVHCNFRHMELRKNRKSIPCYWESQPGGCKKPHCPFLHSSPKTIGNSGETSDIKPADNKDTESSSKKSSQVDSNYGSSVVDPLVVNFEEESDNESAPTQSPVKKQRVVKVKTLEEIKLERIQAESAAYYFYPEINAKDGGEFLRNRIIKRLNTKSSEKVEILTLDEIRKRKNRDADITTSSESRPKKQRVTLNRKRTAVSLDDIKIKTLAEIKAERSKRFDSEQSGDVESAKNEMTSETEVSSTSKIDEAPKMQCEESPQLESAISERMTNMEQESSDSERITNMEQESSDSERITNAEPKTKEERDKDNLDKQDITFDSSKYYDDLLLDDDNSSTSPITLKAEEDILNDIDNLLNE